MLLLEQGIILTKEDVAQIVRTRDFRMHKLGAQSARAQRLEQLSIAELVKLMLRRLGL
ncbi:MAG: hypothetical protein Devi2KO_25700 [Devosia indica]